MKPNRIPFAFVAPFAPWTTRLGAVAVGAALAGTLQACTFDVTIGNGERLTQARDVSDFDQIEVASFVDTDLEIGSPFAVAITCDSNVVEFIETNVEGGTLVISTPIDKMISTDMECRAAVRMPDVVAIANTGSGDFISDATLDAVETLENTGSGDLLLADVSVPAGEILVANTGSGDVVVTELSARDLSADNLGSGDVTLAGTARNLEVSNQGSGDVMARDLDARDVVLHNTGSGDVTVTASDSATGEATGSGDVDVFGEPSERDIAITGSGSVSFR